MLAELLTGVRPYAETGEMDYSNPSTLKAYRIAVVFSNVGGFCWLRSFLPGSVPLRSDLTLDSILGAVEALRTDLNLFFSCNPRDSDAFRAQ